MQSIQSKPETSLSKKSRISRSILIPAIGLINLCLMPSCTTSTGGSVQIQVIKPPSYLLQKCERPEIKKIETNRDLLIYLYSLEYKFDICASQTEALIEFYSEER